MEHFDATIRDGALILSARAAEALGIVPGRKSTLSAEVSGDELTVRNEDWIVQAQEMLAKYLPAHGGSVVDGLIAERRAEAAREEWEAKRDFSEHAHWRV